MPNPTGLIQGTLSSTQIAIGNCGFEGSSDPEYGWFGREYDLTLFIEDPSSLPLNLAAQLLARILYHYRFHEI
jgi:DNA-binding NtrC family response regulator